MSFEGGFGRLDGELIRVMRGSLEGLLRGEEGDDAGSTPIAAATVTMKAPVSSPSKILSIGPNYPGEGSQPGFEPAAPDRLSLFGMFASTIIGPDEPIVIPRGVVDVDYEGELAVVVGRQMKDVSAAEAAAGIAGYTCANDVSARAIQYSSQFDGLTRGKCIDTFLPLGPALVTSDEIADVRRLTVTTRLNGSVVQQFSTAEMFFGPAELLSSISETITLMPGDVVITGTGAGSGFTRTPPVWLSDGDDISVEIQDVGVLRNAVRNAA